MFATCINWIIALLVLLLLLQVGENKIPDLDLAEKKNVLANMNYYCEDKYASRGGMQWLDGNFERLG